MPITRNFTLYLNAGISVAPTVHVNQSDRGEQWIFTLLDDKGQKYTPSDGALIGVKADGHAIVGVTGTVGSDGNIYITETQQMTAAAGKAIFELTIDGMTHGTANFIVQVEKKPTDDAVLSESDLSIIQQGIDSVTPAAINETVSEYLAEHMTNPPIDPTLTVSNAAADAKVTGDKITDLKNALKDFEGDTFETVTGKNLYNPEDTTVGFLLSDGSVSATSSYSAYLTSGFIPIENNTTYFFTERTAVGAITSTRYSSLLYSEDKTPITESYQNVDATSGIAIVVNDATAKYMRVSVHYWEGRLLQVEKGESATSYQPYSKAYKLIAELGDAPTAQVEEFINNSGLFATEIGKNLVNSENLVKGAVQSTGVISTAGSWATYSTSDFIPLDANTDYVFSTFSTTTGNSTTNRKTLLLYDSSKTVINNTYQNVDGAFQLTFNSSDNAKFVRVSSWASVLFQLEKGTTRTPYAPYKADVVLGIGLGETPMRQAQSSNILYRKKWAVCGDSFTNGATSNMLPDGKYQGYRKVYPYLIGNRNNMDIVKFFEGGRTLAFPADPGTFTNSLTNPNADWYYQNIPTDVDYITIYLGINDEHHAPGSSGGDGEDNTGEIPIGTINDSTTATYLGAWNVVLTWLISNRPNAHIGIIVTNGNQNKDEYRQGQIAIAEKYGIPYIDLNGDARTPAMIRTSNPNIPSVIKTALIQKWAVNPSTNTHPNDAAHEFESMFIENFLRSI